MDSAQDTPDVEMNQSSIMSNQAVDQSMTETEEDLAAAETLSAYDTLDGCHTIQEPQPYITLEAIIPDEKINHAKEMEKPND